LEEDPLHTPPRLRARIIPASPITTAIEDETGVNLAYGVLANVSETGACIWTDGLLEPGLSLRLRISFANPPEVHEVAARVVWGDTSQAGAEMPLRRYGLEWCDASPACVQRIRDLAVRSSAEVVRPRPATAPHTPPSGLTPPGGVH
jgi:hypothetical protein